MRFLVCSFPSGISPNFLDIPPTMIVKFEMLESVHYFQASRLIKGVRLSHVLNYHPDLISKLDSFNFTGNFDTVERQAAKCFQHTKYALILAYTSPNEVRKGEKRKQSKNSKITFLGTKMKSLGLVILSLLVDPADWKADNFIVQLHLDDHGGAPHISLAVLSC